MSGYHVELHHYLLLAGVGVLVGFVNVMAGGGSLLSLPVMIFLGFPPAMANGTNRVALIAQNVTAVASFRRLGFSDWRLSASLGLCAIPGAIAGAVFAVRIDPLLFKQILAVVMIGVMVVTLWRPKRPAPETASTDERGSDEAAPPEDEAAPPDRRRLVLAHVAMLGVGLYGGFIQAGVGFILMAVLRCLLRLDLVRVNMHKVFVVGIYMVPSLVVFAALGQVRWIAGGVLAIGAATGALLATRLQAKKGEGPVRVVFALAVVAMAVKLVLD